MTRNEHRNTAMVAAILVCFVGCQTAKPRQAPNAPPLAQRPAVQTEQKAASNEAPPVRLASHLQGQELPAPPKSPVRELESLGPAVAFQPIESLEDLEAQASANSPTLRRMQQEASAEWAKTGYVSKLPDPTVSSMFFVPPMNFEPDRQVAEIQVMQMIPWLGRLKAEAQQAYYEALVAENQYQAERLRVIGDVRMNWYRLYVLMKQIETTEADKSQLQALIETANARVATGAAQPGDVLMATLESSSLQEQLLGYRQQAASTQAEINRLVGRPANSPVYPPTFIKAELPDWSHELLRCTAIATQPELNAARLQTAAKRWGIEVARLKRRPDVTVSGGWVVMDAPGSMMPGDGRDSYTLGVSTTLPIQHKKYDAMVSEASSEHLAAHASEDEVVLKLDATLRDLWEQARAAAQTVELYETTILPQARQNFEADQKSLANNNVAFDRVIRSYRSLLNLQLGYHKALGQLATSIARIRQTVGVDLLPTAKTASSQGD